MENIFNFRQICAKSYAIFFVWASDSRGVTAIETGLLVGGISTVLAGAGFAYGDELNALIKTFSSAAESAVATGYGG
jgi:Flp pilus assembly pilin Flp